LREAAGWNRRKPAAADHDLGRLNWAVSAPTVVAFGRTGGRAVARHPAASAEYLHRPDWS
jgi:hypothetical protein